MSRITKVRIPRDQRMCPRPEGVRHKKKTIHTMAHIPAIARYANYGYYLFYRPFGSRWTIVGQNPIAVEGLIQKIISCSRGACVKGECLWRPFRHLRQLDSVISIKLTTNKKASFSSRIYHVSLAQRVNSHDAEDIRTKMAIGKRNCGYLELHWGGSHSGKCASKITAFSYKCDQTEQNSTRIFVFFFNIFTSSI